MRAVYARLDAVASGRANPATAAEAIELAEGTHRLTRRRYVLAARLYGRAFATDPALAGAIPADIAFWLGVGSAVASWLGLLLMALGWWL